MYGSQPRPPRLVPMRFRDVIYLRTERATVPSGNRPGSWRVAVLAHFDDQFDREQFEVIEVRISAHDNPTAGLHPFQPAELIGFHVREYQPEPGRTVQWFAAEQVRGRS
jgi:hypothetical protein